MFPLDERRGPQPDSCCQAPTQHGGQLGFSDLGSTSALYILDEGFLGTICLNPQWPCSHSYRTRTPSLERTATSGRRTSSTPRRTQVSSSTENLDLSTWTAWSCSGRGRGRRWCCRGRRGSPASPPWPGRQACLSYCCLDFFISSICQTHVMLIIPTAFIAMKIWINHDTASVQGPAGEAAAGGGQLARRPPARNPQEWAAQVDKVGVIFATQTFYFYVLEGKFHFSREYTTFTFQMENTTFTFSGTMRRLTSLEPEHATAAKKYICDGRNVLMMKEIHFDRWKVWKKWKGCTNSKVPQKYLQ